MEEEYFEFKEYKEHETIEFRENKFISFIIDEDQDKFIEIFICDGQGPGIGINLRKNQALEVKNKLNKVIKKL